MTFIPVRRAVTKCPSSCRNTETINPATNTSDHGFLTPSQASNPTTTNTVVNVVAELFLIAFGSSTAPPAAISLRNFEYNELNEKLPFAPTVALLHLLLKYLQLQWQLDRHGVAWLIQ